MSNNFKNLASQQDTLTANFPTIHRTYTMNKTQAVSKCTAISNYGAMHRTYTMNKMRALNKHQWTFNYGDINRTNTMNKDKAQPIIIATKPCENTPFLQGFYWLVFFYLCFHSTSLTAQIPHFRQHPFPEIIDLLDTIKNAPPLELNCLTQTPDGILWLGSNRGLIRYNGTEIQLFPTETGVTALFSSVKRGLWLGCANGQISYFGKNNITIWQREEALPKVKITDFAEDTSGNLWFSTYGAGVYCFDQKRVYHFTTKDNLVANVVNAITSNQANEILLATDKGLSICQLIKGNKIIRNVTNTNDLADLTIKAFAKLPLGNVSAGFNNGYFGNILTHNWLKINGAISCLTQFEPNGFVIGTEENGVYFADLLYDRIDKVPPSVGRHIKRTFKDNEGNIWVISDKNKLFSANSRFIPYKTGLSNMQAVAKNTATASTVKAKNMLIGTKGGAFNFDIKTGQTERFLTANVSSFSTSFNTPFISSFDAGLFLKSDKETVHLTAENGLSNPHISTLINRKDTSWAASLGGLFRLISTPLGWEIINFNVNDGLSTDAIHTVFEDSQRHIWLGTEGRGVTFFNAKSSFKHFNTSKQNTALGTIKSIVEVPKGTIWLANTEGSFFCGNETTGFTVLSNAKKIGHQILTGMSVDGQGNIVVLTNKGLELIDPTRKNRARFGTEIGLSSFDSSLNPFCTDDINSFWCVTSTDLIRMPYVGSYQKTRPTPILKDVKISMQNIDFETITSFSANQNYLTFDIEGVWLTNPESVRCRYKLVGIDPAWQTTKVNSITYPNLPAGHYTFCLQASLTDDFTGADETLYTFDIAKPIWRQWWFLLLMLVVSGYLFYLFIKKREDNLTKEAALKRDKVVSQLELLKSQISPHFLFNSFNTLIATIENDPKSAVEFTEHLSDFYRNILKIRQKDVISIQEEQELLTNYIFLLEKRHGNNLHITMHLTGCFDRKIVPLTLQILVENAVKHNVVSKSRPLSILIAETENGFIEVKNNVQKKLNTEVGTGFGLSSLSSRYELLTGKKVDIVETKDVFWVRIPMI